MSPASVDVGPASPTGSAPRPRNISNATNGPSNVSAMVRPKSSGGISHFTKGSDEDQKTAVKVAIRLRPPLQPSDPNYDLIPARFRKGSCQVPTPTTLAIESSQGKKTFVFDRVFQDTEKQDAVWEYVSGGVDSFVQGYNVSVLAYGQSGAGKSYTMGTTEPEEQRHTSSVGIVPRAAAALFERLSPSASKQINGSGIRMPKRYSQLSMAGENSATKKENRNWQLAASYVEIYNERLRDLLVPDTEPQTERTHVTIREDTKGKIILTGLKQVPINNVEDLMNVLYLGSSIRQTDATAINSKSSRSHAVLSLNLVQKRNRSFDGSFDKRVSMPLDATNGESAVTIDSKLHFVDLAGSERLKNSGLTGERVKEGISINAGLASLGKVISQLSSRSSGSHVSYRDSRLTRMLQDSLGGNAITYMIACVNPVEFHLSETLNTVQYAQRARAIQSRPQIQQRSDDGDKQLIIDRLRSEIKFLREQIRSSQQGERRKTSSNDRSLRNMDRENELQNQILDIQENYSALSQRHAKLISELSHGNATNTDKLPNLKSALEYTTKDRISRSNTFAEQVEQVILEYEKTIQSLESSLSNSRSSLSTSESNLLEREARIVYLEAMTQQLQTRIGKVIDREANSENHLRELESQLDNVTSGEEKQALIISDLRSEMQRARDSEISAEEYISTLEERLAEAEQDTEIMQREIARLEGVIERQRSVGKLDNLMSELDNLRQDNSAQASGASPESHEAPSTDFFHDRLVATASGPHPHSELEPEVAEEEWRSFGPMDGDDETQSQFTSASHEATKAGAADPYRPTGTQVNGDEKVHSPAQAKAIADKLETITMELFELRGEHDNTTAELEDVSRKYTVALTTLAELQDAVSPSRKNQSSSSFLDRAVVQDSREDGQRSSSRMLSSALSSRGESPTLVGESEPSSTLLSDGGDYRSPRISQYIHKEESLAESVRALRRSNAEKDISINQLTENYSQLEDQHKDTLKYIDELKEEMQKVQAVPVPEPTPAAALTPPPNLNRRRSNIGKDREGRVFAALQNLALEHLHSNPEAMRDFETNMGAMMTESQIRQERFSTVESELAAAKKELGVKQTMISGLSRERASRSAVTTDVALVNTIKEHLVQTQHYMAGLQESNRDHEERLATGVRSFAARLADKPDTDATSPPSSTSKQQDEDLSTGLDSAAKSTDRGFGLTARPQDNPADDLQTHLATWHDSHRSTFEAVQALEQQLAHAINGLEVSIRNAEVMNSETAAARELRSDIRPSRNSGEWEAEKAQLVSQVQNLEEELSTNRSKTKEHADKVALMERDLVSIKRDTRSDAKNRDRTDNELRSLRELVTNLEDQLDQQKAIATFHEQGLRSATEAHERQLGDLTSALQTERSASSRAIADQDAKNSDTASSLQQELTKAHMEMASLMQSVSVAFQEETEPSDLQTRLQTLMDDRKTLSTKHDAAAEALAAAHAETREVKGTHADLQSKVNEMTAANEVLMGQLDKTVDKEQKSSRLVERLEEQLKINFEQHKTANLRLSSAQKERADVEKELIDHRGRVTSLETQLLEMKRLTSASHQSARDSTGETDSLPLRKSASQASIPRSPPPATPLPPLPAMSESASTIARPTTPKATSPPDARMSKESPTLQQQQQDSQISSLSNRVELLEKKLSAEKTLTQTLEEALVDLENTHNTTRKEADAWKARAKEIEQESFKMNSERKTMRNSIQQLQEEKMRRKTAEEATKRLEEQMAQLGGESGKKKKKNTLNCF